MENLKDILLSSHVQSVKFAAKSEFHANLVKMSTALHVACLQNNMDTVKYLLDRSKIDVNYLDRTGSTALMYAAWKGYLPLVKLLVLQYGADPRIKNFKNGTAEKYARHAGWKKVAEFLRIQAQQQNKN